MHMGSQTTTLSVTGMHCASCAARVERELTAAPGVDSASVNLTTETATVSWHAPQQSVQRLTDIVTKAGFQAKPANENTTQETDARHKRESATLKRDTLLAALLTLPVFLLEMGSHFIPGVGSWVHTTIGHQNSWLAQFILMSVVLIGPGRSFARTGWPALVRGTPDMNSLVALGTTAAWGYSTVALFAPNFLPAGTRAVYFEAVGVIITLILLGRFLEHNAKARAGNAIRALIKLQPQTALVHKNNTWAELDRSALRPGDLIRIRPGEAIATDGTVASGSSWVDESMISGEPVPVTKSEGDPVIGGTINGTGTLEIRATATGDDTVLANILHMVEQAQGAKLPIQSTVDHIIRWFVPAILSIAVLTIALWLIFGPSPAIGLAMVCAVSVLIVACPCAMGLATPTSITVATGRAAELGVLFRKGDVLQTLQSATVIAFDKTGTLTQGTPHLTQTLTHGGIDQNTLLTYAASVEALSEHPLSDAITSAAAQRGLPLLPTTGFKAIPGKGVEASVDQKTVLIGNAAHMTAHKVDISALASDAQHLNAEGNTCVFIAVDGAPAGLCAISDPIKPEAADTIAQIKNAGLRTLMLTGDTEATARSVADALDIDTVQAALLPADKAQAIKALQDQGQIVAFVGDGINDAPALSTAEIGIAIGTGTDVAIEAAEVILSSNKLTGVTRALQISRATLRNIRQNLFWAFAYNTALIPIAAGLLYPLTGTLLSPMLAAGAMALSSLFVLTNALRLKRLTGDLT